MKQNIDFREREKHWQKFWKRQNIYKFDSTKKEPIFSIDTPPIYISADSLHIGHAMSYIQADIIARYKRMRGYNVFYPNGFDDNGLPTERFIEKKYKIDKSKIQRKEFVNICIEETKKQGKRYQQMFNDLGISFDWSLIYNTINSHCQRTAQRSFIDLYQKGLIIRKQEPVLWCPFCQSAISQAEIQDQEQDSYLNYISFKVIGLDEQLTIATTRPELLPACVALYVNSQDKRYQKYIGAKAIVPLFDYQVSILADKSVDPEYGTGIMMTCTWGDSEDVRQWKKDNLETRISLTKDGRLTDIAGKYQGLKINKAREAIIKDLKNDNLLLKQEKITHICNVHDKCQTTIEFILTPQWFIKISENKKQWQKRGEEINWYPLFMKTKYDAWIQGLKWDWCISRQRYYGVPFPVWYCKECQEVLLAEDKDLPVDPRQQSFNKHCHKCQSKNIRPENDVMDTWMTSSVTPLINAFWQYSESEKQDLMKKIYPMSLRPQGLDIIKTWLFYTVVKSHYHTDSLPWGDVMISGWGVDEKGKKMSKSLGNFVEPMKIIENYPTDALRYWTTKSALGHNLRYSEQEVKKGKRTVIKLLNASKFCFIHLKDYSSTEIDFSKIDILDRGILTILQETIQEYCRYLDQYQFSKARQVIESFFWNFFCDNYLEIIKEKLYNLENYNSQSIQSTLFTLYTCLLAIIKLYAPFLVFITEEIYQLYFAKNEKQISIHLTKIADCDKKMIDKEAQEQFMIIAKIIADIRKYKSENNLSLRAEIEKIVIQGAEEKIKDFFNIIKNTMNIKEISFKQGTNKDYLVEIIID